MESPVQLSARIARIDTEVAGVSVRRGELIVIYLAAAGRIPRCSPILTASTCAGPTPNKHLAFSREALLPGAALARSEGRSACADSSNTFPMFDSPGSAPAVTLASCAGGRNCP